MDFVMDVILFRGEDIDCCIDQEIRTLIVGKRVKVRMKCASSIEKELRQLDRYSKHDVQCKEHMLEILLMHPDFLPLVRPLSSASFAI